MIEHLNGMASNCYLIRGKEKSVLVDIGTRKGAERLYEKIKDLNVSLIVLTHGHPDHIGGAAYLSKKLGVPIAMNKDDVRLLKQEGMIPMSADSFLGKAIIFFTKFMKMNPENSFEPEIFLENGQNLDIYGIDAVVNSLPGHTSGSIGILVEGKDFIVGDVMMNVMGTTGARLYEDYEIMKKSLNIIGKSTAERIYVGHGKPFKKDKFFK